MKIHQIFLFLIGLWMIYAWNKGTLFAHPEQKLLHRQTDFEKSLGFNPNNIIPKIFKYGLLYFVQFISDPFNLTLVMMCVFSRIVFNFLTIHVHMNCKEIWINYDVDESYFVPIDSNNQFDPEDLV